VKKIFGRHIQKDEDDEKKQEGSLTHTGRLGETMRESLDVVKIAVFNYV
jgi:ATP-dependent Lon protease